MPHQLSANQKGLRVQFCRQSRHVFDIMSQNQRSSQQFGCQKPIRVQPRITEQTLRQANGGYFLHEVEFNQVDTIHTC